MIGQACILRGSRSTHRAAGVLPLRSARRVVSAIFLLLFLPVPILHTSSALGAISTNWQDYAIVGQSTVSLNTYSTVLGDVYAGGNLTAQFGFGIQEPSQNAGNMYTRGNFFEDLGSQVTGNVAANGIATLNYSSARLNGNLTYGGNVVYGNGASRSQITGAVTQAANAVALVPLPAPTTFSIGTNNITTSSDLTLAPGSYGDVNFNGLYDNLYLSSGNYYLKSFTAPSSSYIHLDLTNGPIRFYVQGNTTFSTYSHLYVNGTEVSSSMTPAQRSLASNVLFETHGNFSFSNPIGGFFGTIFAPYGTVNLEVEQAYGSILAGGAVNSEAYVTKVTSSGLQSPSLMISASTPTVITGGPTNLATCVQNLTSSGPAIAYNLGVVSQVGPGILGGFTPGSGSVASGSSQNHALSFTSSTPGLTAIALHAVDPGTSNDLAGVLISVTTLDHASPVLSPSTSATRVMKGATFAPTTTLSNTSATYRAGLQVAGLGGLSGSTGGNVGSVIANGGSVTLTAPAVDTTTTGTFSTSYTVSSSDDQSVPGATARPDCTFTVSGAVLDNRRVTAPANTDIGYVHVGGNLTCLLAISTTGDDNHYTRITVANSAASDANGISVSGGSTAFRFGLDGMSTTRTIGGTPSGLGNLQGTLSLTTSAESGVVGTQSLANVTVNYTVHVFSGKATWNAATGGSWANHPIWQDYQSLSGGAPGIGGYSGDTAFFGNSISAGAANVSLDGSSPRLASLMFSNYMGGSYTISAGSGGTLTLSTTSGNPAIVDLNGSHQITAPVILSGTTDVTVTNALDTLTLSGNVSAAGGLNKAGSGVLSLSGTNSFACPLVVTAGTLQASVAALGGPNTSITNNSVVEFNQPIDAQYSGTISGTGSIAKSGSGKLTLAGADNILTPGSISIRQGTLSAPYGLPHSGAGILLGSNGTFEAAQSVCQAVSGTGAITATDDLTIGKSSQLGQFNLGGSPGVGGTLNVGRHAVVILSLDTAILGSQTNLDDGGSLTTLHGAQLGNHSSLDASKVLSATGNVTINGDFINNGLVHGPSDPGQWLAFTQDVSGEGSTTGNISYLGGYSPGNSPATVFAENLLFDPASTLVMDVDGLLPGAQYDQINVSGIATLHGTLQINPLNGYSLQPGEQYQLFAAGRWASSSESSACPQDGN